MNDNELIAKNVRSVVMSIAATIVGACVANMGSNIYHDWVTLEAVRVNSTDGAKKVAEARAVEAKSLAEKAMWEAQKK